MRTRLFVWASLALAALGLPASAKPIVQGYERFHANAPSVEGGALLFSELGCANCHPKATGVPSRRGPNLRDVTKRLRRDWLRAFLLAPEATSPGSTMPNLLATLPEADREGAADDLLAWLATLQTKSKYGPPRHASFRQGRIAFEELGCVACHADHAKLPDLPAKTAFGPLHHFLQNTHDFRPDGRMPSFRLDAQAAANLTAYLLDFRASDPRIAPTPPAPPKPAAGQVERGKTLARKLRCAACHDDTGLKPPVPLPPLASSKANANFGALPGHPAYALDDARRQAIRAFLGAEATESPDVATLTLAALNCLACHSRDGKGGPTPQAETHFTGDPSLGDSGRLPPPLTGIGHKLRPDPMRRIFTGEEKRARPYLRSQMPRYPALASKLTSLLQKADAPRQTRPPLPPPHPPDLQAGYRLLGSQGGFNCITCHHWGERPALGIQALDLKTMTARLRPDWFHAYLLRPQAYRPDTLMPAFWPNEKSGVPDVLGGDPDKQIAALWAALAEQKSLPPGFPEHVPGTFELIPANRPILQRTFFQGIGTGALLAGFPGGVNLGYDTASAQPKLLWKGRFIDAYNTWFVRKFPFETPLEKHTLAFPDAPAGDFLGYELEKDGSPTFLGRGFRETFRAQGGKLLRIVTPASKTVTHPPGVQVTQGREGASATYLYAFE